MNVQHPLQARAMPRKPVSIRKNRGFFDFGLALIILAVSGLSVYSIEADQAQTAEAPATIETASIAEIGAE